MVKDTVVTRFAPSPTGALHVGGARTALYNWAFAKRHGGHFLLRIEDTDQKRSSEAAARRILEDLAWLGLDWEGTPAYQSERLALYDQHVQRLLDQGAAYDDAGAVRFRMDRDISFDDIVYGPVQVKAQDLEDFIIRKGDGFPTFHLAVVVDDALMGVTHVIRGQEHLTNTTKHVALQEALGLGRPVYAHTPSILNPDGSKMSKRDKAKAARKAAREHPDQDQLIEACRAIAGLHAGSTGFAAADVRQFIDAGNDRDDIAKAIAHVLGIPLPEIDVADFRRSGYLPGVLCNSIALLGWNPGGGRERFDLGFLESSFSLERINRANPRFDRDKLAAFNGDTLQKMQPDAFTDLLRRHLGDFHHPHLERLGERFESFARAYQPRSRTLEDPVSLGRFFLTEDEGVQYDFEAKPVRKVMGSNGGEAFGVLRELKELLRGCDPWSGQAAEHVVRALADGKGMTMGQVAQPLRVAISGSTVTPPLDATLQILGKDATLARIQRCLERGGAGGS